MSLFILSSKNLTYADVAHIYTISCSKPWALKNKTIILYISPGINNAHSKKDERN